MMNESKPHLPSLNNLIKRLRAASILLRWDVTASGKMILLANKSIPAQLRHLMWRYSRELTILHILADIRICRDPASHSWAWHHLSGTSKFICCSVCFEMGLDNNYPLQGIPSERLVAMQAKEDAIDEVAA